MITLAAGAVFPSIAIHRLGGVVRLGLGISRADATGRWSLSIATCTARFAKPTLRHRR